MFQLPVSFERALSDQTAGSSATALRVAIELSNQSGPLTRAQFAELAGAILSKRPHFALLFHLLHKVGSECFTEPDGRRNVAEAASVWLALHRQAHRRLELPRPQGRSAQRIVTWSHSGAVRSAILRLHREGTALRICCARSLPGGEGALLASELAAQGVPCELCEDHDIGPALNRDAWVVIGADAIWPREFWNKVGTRLLLQKAAKVGAARLAIATTSKWCHPAWDLSLLPPGSTAAASPLFEVIDNQLVSMFVLDSGQFAPDELESRLPPSPCYPPLKASRSR